MSSLFAAVNRVNSSALFSRIIVASKPLCAANDNTLGVSGDKVLKAALRHFAEHGLCAAEMARKNAERAFFSGDQPGYRWWLAICHTLDKRMADAVSAHFRSGEETGANELPAENLT